MLLEKGHILISSVKIPEQIITHFQNVIWAHYAYDVLFIFRSLSTGSLITTQLLEGI